MPGLVHIATWLTPLATLGLVIVTASAAVFHLRRRETPAAATVVVLLVLAAVTGFLRWQTVPLS